MEIGSILADYAAELLQMEVESSIFGTAKFTLFGALGRGWGIMQLTGFRYLQGHLLTVQISFSGKLYNIITTRSEHWCERQQS
jgi:hypothetical protein